MIVSSLLVILLFFSVYSVISKKLARCVIALGGVGVTLGAIFLSLGANLIGIFQIAIYGGMTAVLIFATSMLTGDEDEK